MCEDAERNFGIQRRIRALLFLLLIFLPASASACGLCVMSQARLVFPFYEQALVVLILWKIVRIIHLAGKESSAHAMTRIFSATTQAFIAFVLMGLAGTFGLFVFLGVDFFVQGGCLLRSFRRGDASYRRIYPITTAIALAALLLLIPISYIRSAGMDRLERFRTYVHPGTAPARQIAQRIANTPQFEVERLRPMLESGNSSDASRAYDILQHRSRAEDLLRFEDIILALPEKDYTFDGRYVSIPVWFSALGIPEPRTKKTLKNWLDLQREQGAASRNGGGLSRPDEVKGVDNSGDVTEQRQQQVENKDEAEAKLEKDSDGGKND